MTATRISAAAVPLALALSAGAFLAACGSDSDDAKPATTTEAATAVTTTEATTTETAEDEITISGQWARTSPSMTSAGAVYLQITNGTDSDDALFAASVNTAIAGSAEVHENVSSDDDGAMDDDGDMHEGSGGMMTMQEVDEIPVPAGDTVTLEPGGYHIMLVDLVEPLETGDTFEVTLTLTFSYGGDVVVEVEVRDSAP